MQPSYKIRGRSQTFPRDDGQRRDERSTACVLRPEKPEEFFDLANDPHEIYNLAKDQVQGLEEHRLLLDGWITTATRDWRPSDPGLIAVLKRWVSSASPGVRQRRHL